MNKPVAQPKVTAVHPYGIVSDKHEVTEYTTLTPAGDVDTLELSKRTPCALPAVPRRQRIIVPKNSAAGSRITALEEWL